MGARNARRRFAKDLTEHGTAGALPTRGEFVLRNGYVLTMDPSLGDIPGGDVHVRNGEIIAVGKNLKTPGAKVIDARRRIVLPGLIDTHWHMWTSYLRCMAGDKPEDGYFPVTTAYGQAMRPEDMYRATRLAAAEAIYSGTTTVNDECHNVRSHDYAVADLRALREVGVRARWSYGAYRGMPLEQPRDLEDLKKMRADWPKYSNGGLIALGFIWGGIGSIAAPVSAEKFEAARMEIETARRLGIPVSLHLSAGENTPPGWVEALFRGNFLGKDLLLIHVLSASPAEMKMVAAAGTSISVSPGSEMRIGYGLAKACDFFDAGVNVCVSADSVPLTGNAHLFGVLKLLRNAENAKAFSEFKLSARRALEFATINGARALGIDHLVGSLTPGKRADLIAVRTDVITMGVVTDAARMLVEAAEPANVDTVVVDGRILKRAGRFTALSPEQVIAGASASLEAVRKRAGRDEPKGEAQNRSGPAGRPRHI
ncbi:MAG TPA: amidohydrolase family protein [Candidatus Dormibacteraeota bacterium]|nr:amidohydrolase family protein [Candidatus Dormibacteraeota bacterium]